MPSIRTKYSEEMRTETAAYILESGRSATSAAAESAVNEACSYNKVTGKRC